ncbi:MAG: UvrD-helicase domain-containing protein [Deltaproteobacteria bacterium]|jgi:ATP-dependent exoDNAse (exonuclease V) beta subunit|nr:UvrD-helicase domain-containing protein [Deltaproteobacteria bacterium]
MDPDFNQSQNAVLDSRSTFCVTAGAGSGKTRTLVEYIVRYVEDDLAHRSLTDILALTFSEKAAADMRLKFTQAVRARLARAREAGDEAAGACWEREARRLGQAEIGTIHGYAFGLVKNYSYLLGLPASLDVDSADSTDADLADVLKDLLNDQQEDLSSLLRQMPLTAVMGPSLTGWLVKCVTRLSSWGLPKLASGVRPPAAKLSDLVANFSEAVASAYDYVTRDDSFDESKYAQFSEAVRELNKIFNVNSVFAPPPEGPSAETTVPGQVPLDNLLLSSFFNDVESAADVTPGLVGPNGPLFPSRVLPARPRPAKPAPDAADVAGGDAAIGSAGHDAAGQDGSGHDAAKGAGHDAAGGRDRAVDLGKDAQKDAAARDASGEPARPRPSYAGSEAELEKILPRLLMAAEKQTARLKGWRKKSGHNHKAEIEEAYEELRSYQASVEAAPFTERLVRLANLIPELVRAKRAARGQISFDDILSKARDLLKNHRAVRDREAARWKLILVDEFQDTNRLQADLIAQLVPEAGLGFSWQGMDWEAAPAKLRVVGDPKQSIYRFRGSEPEIMNNLSETLAGGGGEVLNLDSNYRSQTSLIEFFNSFFPQCLDEKYHPQLPARPSTYETPPVVWLTAEEPERPGGRVLSARLQASLVVTYLGDLFSGKAGVTVSDKGEGGGPDGPPRLPSPRDVAVLMRRRLNSGVFQDALQAAGWPCHTLKGQDLFDAPEVVGLASAYLYLCGRNPDFYLHAALTSPLGPISEETVTALCWPEAPKPVFRSLSWYFQDGSRGWPEGVDPFEVGTLNRLRTIFLGVGEYALRRPPAELLEALVEKRNLLPLLIAGEGGSPERVKGVQFFLAYLKSLPQHSPHRPETSADLVEDLLLGGLSNDDAETDDLTGLPDEGSINIMTVHRSKGLEFPVVIIPEADARPPEDNSGLRISDDGQVVVKFPSETMGSRLEPPEFPQFKDREAVFARAENKRLLYVAATRARDHLAFVGKMPKNPNGSWLSILSQGRDFQKRVRRLEPDYSPAMARFAQFQAGRAEPEPPAAAAGPAPGARSPLYQSLGDLAASPVLAPNADGFIPAMVVAPKPDGFLQLTVTGYCRIFAALRAGAKDFDEAFRRALAWEIQDESTLRAPVGPKDGPTSPSNRGTLFHAIMEVSGMDLDEASCRALVLNRAAWLGFFPSADEVDFLVAKVLRFQNSDQGQELKQTMDEGRLYRREWPFWLRLERDEHGYGPVLLSGSVDLFYMNEKGLGRIVDYKLARGGSSVAYEKQLEIYALAVKKAGFAGELDARLWYSGP